VLSPPYEIKKSFKPDEFKFEDAMLLTACDHYSAFIEASLSHEFGIKSHHLEEARKSIYDEYKYKNFAGINFGTLFDYFRIENK